MSASIYTEKLVSPDDKILAHDLAGAKEYLDKIGLFIESEYGDFKAEWKFYTKKSGWVLKMYSKKRNVLFVVPCYGYFRIAFTFGDKASNSILSSDFPDSIKKDLSGANKYAEGRTIQVEVRTDNDLNNLLKMIRIKMA